jgi:2-keto-4-pentenoate hydratase
MQAMIDDQLASELARRIAEAERTRVPTKQISQLHPEFGIDEAYAVQQAGVRLAEGTGGRCGPARSA